MKNNNILIGISGKKQSGKDTVAKYLFSYIIQNSNQDNNNFIINNKSVIEQYFNEDFSKVYSNLDDNFYKTHIYKFATPLKQIVSILLDLDPSELEKEVVKNTPICDFITYKISFPNRFKSEEYYHDTESLNQRLEELQSSNIFYSLKKINITPRELMQYLGTDVIRNIDPNIWINLLDKTLKKRSQNCGLNIIAITDVRFKNEVDYIRNNNGLIIRVIDTKNHIDDLHISENELNDNQYFDLTIYNNKENVNEFGYFNQLFLNVKHLYDYRIRDLYGK